MSEAAQMSAAITAKAVQFIEPDATATVRSVVPDVVDNAAAMTHETSEADSEDNSSARPTIQRQAVSTERKLLVIPSSEPALNGY